MMRPKAVIEDRLTDAQRDDLNKKCDALPKNSLSTLDYARALDRLSAEAQIAANFPPTM